MIFGLSSTGTAANVISSISSVTLESVGVVNGDTIDLKYSWDGATVTLSYRPVAGEGAWVTLGTPIANATTSLYASTAVYSVGATNNGANDIARGRIQRVQVFDAPDGTLLKDFNPADKAAIGSSWVSSTTGETWTQNGTARIVPSWAIYGIQSTSAARPTRGRMPLGGVRNQLTYSEDVTNAVWTKGGATASNANTIVESAPLSSHVVSQNAVITTGLTYTQSVTLKKGSLALAPDYMQLTFGSAAFGSSQYAIVNVLTGEVVAVYGGASCTSAADPNVSGGFRFTYTATATSSATTSIIGVCFCQNSTAAVRVPSYIGSILADCEVYFSQGELGSSATAYQKVVQAYDVTESGVASVDALWFDGVDDHLVLTATGAGLARNTGRFTVFSSGLYTKALASTQFQFVATMSASAATRASIGGAATNINTVQARRTAADSYAPSLESPASVFTPYIQTAVLSYATQLGELRVNGALADSDATFFTAGNTEDSDSQNVYVARASTSYFGGFMSGVITVKGVTLSESQLLQTERYLGNQIGVTI
jgi:hypothetical protein